jgi:hypothetical protein
MVQVKNVGSMASVATDWRIEIERNGTIHEFPLTYVRTLEFQTIGSDVPVRVAEETAIYNATSSPIPPGGMAQGFAYTVVPMALVDEDAAGSRVFLKCADINGHICVGEKTLKLGGGFQYFPGMQILDKRQ